MLGQIGCHPLSRSGVFSINPILGGFGGYRSPRLDSRRCRRGYKPNSSAKGASEKAQRGRFSRRSRPLGRVLWRCRLNIYFLKKFMLLAGGACFAPEVFVSALRLFTPVWLSQAIRALTPSRFLRAVFSSIFSFVFSVVSPIVQTLSFGALLYLMNGAVGGLVPLVQPIWSLVEGFFICPKGGNMALICVEKQVKILACTFWFGGFSARLTTIFKKNKSVFIALVVFGVGIFAFILRDSTYCHRVAILVMAHFDRLLDNQFGQFGSVLFWGIFMKSAHFSIGTFAFYLS